MKASMVLVVVAALLSIPAAAQMTPAYTLYQSFVFDSANNTLTQTVSIQGTTLGSCTTPCCRSTPYPPYYTCPGCPIPGCAGAIHTANIRNKIGTVGGETVGPAVPAFGYINYSTSVTATLTPGVISQGDGNGCVSCSVIGTFWCLGGNIEVEAAFTRTDWRGSPPPTCSGSGQQTECRYPTVNNCTPETTPPDLNVVAVDSGDYRGIATYLSWMNVAACIRFHQGQSWTCTKPFAQLQGINSQMPPYACTHNP